MTLLRGECACHGVEVEGQIRSEVVPGAPATVMRINLGQTSTRCYQVVEYLRGCPVLHDLPVATAVQTSR
jgi:hypothetical protein